MQTIKIDYKLLRLYTLTKDNLNICLLQRSNTVFFYFRINSANKTYITIIKMCYIKIKKVFI